MTRRIMQAIVTVTLLGLIVWAIDVDKALVHLGQVKPIVLLLVLALVLIQNDIVTTRWASLLATLADPLPHHRLLRMQYMGLFAQLFLPASIGGAAVRAWMVHRAGTGLAAAINSVILDRLAAFLGLATLTLLVLPFVWTLLFDATLSRTLYLGLAAAGVAAAILGAVLWRWPPSFWFDRLETSFLAPLTRLLRDTGHRILRPWLITKVLGLTLLGQSLTMVSVFVLAQGAGIQVNLIDCLFLMPPVMLLASLPISVAGWGVREGAMIVAFGLIGVEREAALVLSVQFALIGAMTALIGVVFWHRESSTAFLEGIKKLRARI